MLTFVFFLALACSGGEAAKAPKPPAEAPKLPMIDVPASITPASGSTTQPTVNLASSKSMWWRALDHLAEGTYQFPPTTPGTVSDGRFKLSEKWADEGARKGGWNSYSTPLPFATSMPRPNYAPMGARFLRDGEEIPFNTTISAPQSETVATWYIDHGRIVILSIDNPSAWEPPAELIVDELAADIKKRSLATSGLSPAEFARQSHQSDRVERPALYLPAPATASFPITLPTQGKLSFGLGILDDPLTGKPSGDGAEVVAKLDGTQIWKGRAEPADPHRAVSIDVSGEPGKTYTLSFESAPGAEPSGDYIVLTNPVITDSSVTTPRRVVIVAIDTLRWDTLQSNGYARDTSPELDQWLSQSVQFDQAYAPAPRTKPSFRTAFTGLNPSNAVGATTLAERLSKAGFATGGVVGNVHLVPRFGFARGMDHWEYENGARGADQVDRSLAWLKAHENEDAYLFVHFMDPHTFYNSPDAWADKYSKRADRPKGVPTKFDRWQIINLDKKRKLDDAGKAWIRGQYDAEVAYTTHQVSRLLAAIDTMAGPTLTVLHTDHGEEFWDHHGFEHNHSLYNELVQVEFAVRPPKGWQGAPRVKEPVSLADLVPTVLDFAGVPEADRGPTDGLSLRPFIDAASASALEATKASLVARPLALGHLRYDRDRWGVVLQNKKFILQTASGKEELYDLAADPKETNDLRRDADPKLLATMREALGKATTWPVRRGYRFRIPNPADKTTVVFSAPIAAAGIIDPQWNARIRANTEWGEVPPVTVADVGTVELSSDKRTITFVPGDKPFGQAWWLQCESDPCPEGKLTMGKNSVVLSKSDNSAGGTRYSIEPGYVMAPDDRSEYPEVAGRVDATDVEALETLGYLQKDDEN